MDGVEQLNNILIIGMTNRKDMIDEALLRPGKLYFFLFTLIKNEYVKGDGFKKYSFTEMHLYIYFCFYQIIIYRSFGSTYGSWIT